MLSLFCAPIRAGSSSTSPASFLTDRVRLVAPVIMGATCVDCHNSHPESPKRDWKVGDVRGIQEVSVEPADRRATSSRSNIC